MDYKNIVVRKPWGHEYLLYENGNIGIWFLNIKHRQKTSLHCHPNKRTALIVLSGVAEVSFINGSQILKPGQKIMIRSGVFHSTEALSDLKIMEVETPNDKEDLLRLEDSYGRAGKPYEDEDSHTHDIQMIKLENNTVIGDCVLNILKINNVKEIPENCNLVLLEGQIYYNNYPVCLPGDSMDSDTLVKFMNKFDYTELKVLEIKLQA